MRSQLRQNTLAAGVDPLRDLVVQADTLAFTLDLAAALLEHERPHLAALWRRKAEAARRAIRTLQAL
ncbi:MAG TPA: hypothetical protein VFK79_17980 [Xanthobacteraceae bacterium]|nr:hypothetical protein [Xanthobacteraceae bacterium]